MRQLITTPSTESVPPDIERWRERMLAYARDPEQVGFTALRPEETGLDRTIFVSEWDEYPALIVDACPGSFRGTHQARSGASGAA